MSRRTRRHFVASLTTALALLLAACAGGGRARPPEPATYLQVRNQSWLDQTVYVVRGGQRTRLGTVTGSSTGRFRIPASLIFGATPLSFVADPIGSERVATSFEIVVSPGETVTLTIPPS
ncbi:MAG TPA: hypothetical protein VEA99_12545 [Gemmatimonadaceae bacterium]|nr:hypothetical protein [Gemmatimonadaceae bacterium]